MFFINSKNKKINDVDKEVAIYLIDCNPWFTFQHNNSMRRFAPETDPFQMTQKGNENGKTGS